MMKNQMEKTMENDGMGAGVAGTLDVTPVSRE